MTRLACKVAALLLIGVIASVASAADNAMFNYQGRVLVQGMPYTGTGQMKVAILATSGTSALISLWSNDGSSSAGSEPTASFDVAVTGGVFDAMIGDASLGMASIPAILFNRDDELKVRVWFNDGTHGFQQLSPDRRLTNPRRLGVTDIHSTTTLYVNASTGNDLNSGLSSSTPKKTIQAAVDMVPNRLFATVTIDLATGVYRESVKISGIQALSPYKLIISGDKTTIPSDTVSPTVRLTGADNDGTHARVRYDGILISGCYNVELQGLLIDYYSGNGVNAPMSSVSVTRCKASYITSRGFASSTGEMVVVYSWASYADSGYHATGGNYSIGNSGASDSTFGIMGINYAAMYLVGTNYARRNTYGIACQSSYIWFDITSTNYVANNTTGVFLYFHSCSRLISRVSYSANGTNSSIAADSWAE